MNRKLLIPTLVITLVIVGSGVIYAVVRSNNNKRVAEQAAMMKKDEAKMAKDESVTANTGDAMMIKGSFSEYDQAKLANAEKGKVVLFFSANWCPTCQEANKNFKATTPPEGLTLLKVDYDNSNELKKKYGVTYQHTYVEVDKEGTLIKKWSGSTTYDQIEKQLN